MILQHLCKLRCNLLCCFKFNQWRRNFAKMGACCCSGSEFDGESHEAARNLRRHYRWCSMMFKISTMFRLNLRFLKETIFRHKIWFTSGFHCADIARKLVFPNFQHFAPDFCGAAHVMLGPQMTPGGLFIGREFWWRNSDSSGEAEATSRCDT